MTTVIQTLSYGKGYAGPSGNKCWVARILGTDARHGLARSFLEPLKVEREHFNRSRTMIQFSYELQVDGLYELSESGERWFVAVYPSVKEPGEIRIGKISDARVKAWVAALDEGKTNLEARIASKGL